MTKKKNELLIQQRREQLIKKYTLNEEKIKKQKEDNDKVLMNKYLLSALKRDDTAENLSRYERQQELGRKLKVQKIEQINQKMLNMQKEIEKISKQKIKIGMNMAEVRDILNQRKIFIEKYSIMMNWSP